MWELLILLLTLSIKWLRERWLNDSSSLKRKLRSSLIGVASLWENFWHSGPSRNWDSWFQEGTCWYRISPASVEVIYPQAFRVLPLPYALRYASSPGEDIIILLAALRSRSQTHCPSSFINSTKLLLFAVFFKLYNYITNINLMNYENFMITWTLSIQGN